MNTGTNYVCGDSLSGIEFSCGSKLYNCLTHVGNVFLEGIDHVGRKEAAVFDAVALEKLDIDKLRRLKCFRCFGDGDEHAVCLIYKADADKDYKEDYEYIENDVDDQRDFGVRGLLASGFYFRGVLIEKLGSWFCDDH